MASGLLSSGAGGWPHLGGNRAGGRDVVKLGVHIVRAADLSQDLLRLVGWQSTVGTLHRTSAVIKKCNSRTGHRASIVELGTGKVLQDMQQGEPHPLGGQ